VPAVLVPFWTFDHAGTDGIKMDIPDELQQIFIFLADYRLIPALKNVANFAVP
jgi:hypothetical protein